MSQKRHISGSGMGGGKGGAGKSDPNSLRSNATVRLIDLLGEGEISGLVNGPRSIFLDGTPLQSDDGTNNFEGISWETRDGLPDQPHIPGFDAVEDEQTVGVQVKKSVPVTRSFVGADLDAVRVTVRIPALASRNEKDGAIKKTSVSYRLEVKAEGGAWENPFGDIVIEGKCTSPYDRQSLLMLPKPYPYTDRWDVRMTRITDDSEEDELQNDTYFASFTRITYGKFMYPFSALVAITANAEQFGQSVPEREYEVYGRIIQVPSNYNPQTRTYSGIWNGTFKWAWTDNPAWVLYDILHSDRFGLGQYITPEQIDKWSLYEIAQYCDELVPDGRGGRGPRFSFNGVIRTQKEAFEALSEIANSFRGMTYWSSGSVMAAQDRPADVSMLANPSNVIGGAFSYQSSAAKARHTVALVKFKNKDRDFETDFVVVEDDAGIAKYGYSETTIDATSYCTDKAQAYRIGEWTLFTELNETDVIGYSAGLDHAGVRPGDIVAVQDEAFADWNYNGRAAAGSTRNSVKLDHPVKLEAGKTYTISVAMPNGTIEEKPITTGPGAEVTSVTVSGSFSFAPDHQAVWVISSNVLKPSLWRIISTREAEPNIYEISGVQHEPGKFNHIDFSAKFDPLPTSTERRIQPPTNLTVEESVYLLNGVPKVKLTVSWTSPGEETAAVAYDMFGETPDGRVGYGRTPSNSFTVFDAEPGTYVFYVASVTFDGIVSRHASVEHISFGWTNNGEPSVENLHIVNAPEGEPNQFMGKNVEIAWINVFGGKALPTGGSPLYLHNTVTVYDQFTNEVLRTENVVGSRYTYDYEKNAADNAAKERGPNRRLRFEVTVSDVNGYTSPAKSLNAYNPPPATPVPQAEPGYGQIYLFWKNPTDLDFAGTLVWVGDKEDFEPVIRPEDVLHAGHHEAPAYDTLAAEVVIPAYVTKWVRIGCYDAFGKDGIFISSAVKVDPLNFVVDIEPPAKPTGLVITSSLNEAGQALVEVNWDANTEEDLAQYDLEIAFWDGNFMSIPTGGSYYQFTCEPGTLIRARLRARDVMSNGSFYTDVVQHVAAADTVPPAVPANVQARASFKSIWLTWDNNTEADMLRYEVFVGETDAAPGDLPVQMPTFPSDETTPPEDGEGEGEPPAEPEAPAEPEPVYPQYYVTSNAFVYTGLASGNKRFFWVRAVDTSGNASGWSEMLEAETVSITPVDIDAAQSGLAMPVDTLPNPITDKTPLKVYLKTDKNFYVQRNGAWVNENDASLIIGSILGSQIAPGEIGNTQIGLGSISTPLLRSNAVDARKVRADSIETRHLTANSVIADHLQSDIIDTRHMRAESIGVDQLAADAVTADKIGANQIAARHIISEAIEARHLTTEELITASAQIAEAIIDDAHIIELNAAKLKAGSILSGEVLVENRGSIGSVADGAALGAQDPAARINAGSTRIAPGLVQISGSTYLSDWIRGGDVTRIDGGKISAGTIAANALVVGMRNLAVAGVEFDHSGNVLTWTSGEITVISDSGTRLTTSVSSGNASFSGSTVYIYWTQGSNRLSSTTTISTAFADGNVVIATYDGAANINADYGRTIIDGAKIKTGTVIADQIRANAVDTENIVSGAIIARHITAGEITTDKLRVAGVTTDKLAIGSASVTTGATRSTRFDLTTSFNRVVQATIRMDYAGILFVSGAAACGFPENYSNLEFQLLVNNDVCWQAGGSGHAFYTTPSASGFLAVGAGTHIVSLALRRYDMTGGRVTHDASTIAVIGAKR